MAASGTMLLGIPHPSQTAPSSFHLSPAKFYCHISSYHFTIFGYTTPKITFAGFSKKGTCGEKGKVIGMKGCISTEDRSSRTDENLKRMTQTRKEKRFQRIKRIKKMLCMCPLCRVTRILLKKNEYSEVPIHGIRIFTSFLYLKVMYTLFILDASLFIYVGILCVYVCVHMHVSVYIHENIS